VTRALGLERPTLVANSLGCQVVTALAVRRPERVGALVLIGPTVDPERRLARRQLFAGLRDSVREPWSLLALAAYDDVVVGPGALLATARSALADRIEARLPLIEQPSLVVRGGRDAFVGREWAERVAALLPSGRLVLIRASRTPFTTQRPDLVASVVEGLLLEEREQADAEPVRGFPHGHVAARQEDELRTGQRPLPLLGDRRGRQPAVLAPHKQRGSSNPGELGPQVSV
jgi:2-hydroxy-6-oxonona-2,4-dienedioate hydrolase